MAKVKSFMRILSKLHGCLLCRQKVLKFNIIKEELIMINKLKAFINGIKAISAKAITYVSKEKVRPILNANYF